MVEHRFARREDFVRFYGEAPMTTHGVVVSKDGQPIAIGGIGYERSCVKLYMDMTEEAKRYPVALIKACDMIMGYAKEKGFNLIYSVADEVESSDRFLRRLGFEPFAMNESGVVYRWQSQEQ